MSQDSVALWSVAVQRELDNLHRAIEFHFIDFSNRLDKFLTVTEYSADKRSFDIHIDNANEKIEDSEQDITELKRELRNSFDSLKRDILVERERYEAAISQEEEARRTEYKDFIKARQEQFRWLLSMVLLPMIIAIVELLAVK